MRLARQDLMSTSLLPQFASATSQTEDGHQRRTRNARFRYTCKACEEPEGVEGERRQDVRTGVSSLWVQPKAELLRRSESLRRTCESRPRELLASQVSCDIRNPVPVGWGRSPYRATMAGSLRYGVNHEVSEAVTQQEGAREGQRDFRVGYLESKERLCLSPEQYSSKTNQRENAGTRLDMPWSPIILE